MRLPTLFAAAAGACLVATALMPAPATAAPAAPGAIAQPDSGVAQARWRRHRHHYRRMWRRGDRRYAPSQAGNARDPSRPVRQQLQGNTTGGPRY